MQVVHRVLIITSRVTCEVTVLSWIKGLSVVMLSMVLVTAVSPDDLLIPAMVIMG